jgi:hypothetical protein
LNGIEVLQVYGFVPPAEDGFGVSEQPSGLKPVPFVELPPFQIWAGSFPANKFTRLSAPKTNDKCPEVAPSVAADTVRVYVQVSPVGFMSVFAQPLPGFCPTTQLVEATESKDTQLDPVGAGAQVPLGETETAATLPIAGIKTCQLAVPVSMLILAPEAVTAAAIARAQPESLVIKFCLL